MSTSYVATKKWVRYLLTARRVFAARLVVLLCFSSLILDKISHSLERIPSARSRRLLPNISREQRRRSMSEHHLIPDGLGYDHPVERPIGSDSMGLSGTSASAKDRAVGQASSAHGAAAAMATPSVTSQIGGIVGPSSSTRAAGTLRGDVVTLAEQGALTVGSGQMISSAGVVETGQQAQVIHRPRAVKSKGASVFRLLLSTEKNKDNDSLARMPVDTPLNGAHETDDGNDDGNDEEWTLFMQACSRKCCNRSD